VAASATLSFFQLWRQTELIEQMSQTQIRMSVHHPGTGISHHRLHLPTFVLAVAMDLTMITGRFVLLERAGSQAPSGIVQQLGALAT
jgi:hypothetical protein